MRFCPIGDELAVALADQLASNYTLVALSLHGDGVGDLGGTRLARALRLNRTLKALDLGMNRIGDDTISELASTLTTFTLDHSETVARRLLMASAGGDDQSSDGDGRKTPVSPPKAKAKKGGKNSGKGGKGKDKNGATPTPVAAPPKSPLLKCTRTELNTYVADGNFQLNCINLSHNLLTSKGIQLLEMVINKQAKICDNNGLVSAQLAGNPASTLPCCCELVSKLSSLDPRTARVTEEPQ